MLAPFDVGGAHETVTEDAVARENVSTGRPGTSRDTVDDENGDQDEPYTFLASTRNTCATPLGSPDTVVGDVSGTPGVHSVQEVAADVLNQTCVSAEEAQVSCTEPGAAVAARLEGAAGAVPRSSGAESGEQPSAEQARKSTVDVDDGVRELKVYVVSDAERFDETRVPLWRSSYRVVAGSGAAHVKVAVVDVAADWARTGAVGVEAAETGEVVTARNETAQARNRGNRRTGYTVLASVVRCRVIFNAGCAPKILYGHILRRPVAQGSGRNTRAGQGVECIKTKLGYGGDHGRRI